MAQAPVIGRFHVSRLIHNLLAALLLAVPVPAGTSDCTSLDAADWLLGDWVAGGGKSVFSESWAAAGPQTFEGAGSERALADGMVIARESLRLLEMAGEVFYLAMVAHNELPVAFRLVECGAGQLVFENPGHDFPRRLEYRHEPDGGMAVTVRDGKGKGFSLNFEPGVAAAKAEASVLAAEDARFAAMTGAHAAELASWLADDLLYVHSGGQTANREQFIASIAGGDFRYLEITPIERQVVMLGSGAALVRGKGRFQVESVGARLDLQIRYLAVYDRGGHGHWRLRSWQSLRLPAPSS